MKSNTNFANRLAFDAVAEAYDSSRPPYPAALFHDLVTFCNLSTGDPVLEIGAGSGQATVDLAKLDLNVTALEPGKKLAELAQRKLSNFSNVNVVCDFFEDREFSNQRFAAVISANAFHWIRPEIGYKKAHTVLARDGSIALFWNFPTLPKYYEAAINSVFDRYDAGLKTQYDQDNIRDALNKGAEELLVSGFFEDVREEKYEWQDCMSGHRYVTLLHSYANYATMDAVKKASLFKEMVAFIDGEFGGYISLDNLTALRVAKRVG